MQPHADLSQRVVANTTALAWLDAPSPGVHRRMLERDGAEVARATSVVRYAPGSHFPAHTHGGGEELLVFAGTFADEYGVYPQGTYIRNPVGSRHTPGSPDGCTILVKLWQMHPDDEQRVVVNTQTSPWLAGLVPGLEVMPLHKFTTEQVALVKWAPATHFPYHQHPGGEEIFVLGGVLADEWGTYPAGTWLRNPSGSGHQPFSPTGATIYVKTGHLLPAPQIKR